ncbi:MAG: DMT family transporter [Gammaproteobacteria bacterium]|nr:DMT family transporter [Gammaproteobacteria bacterium]
MDDQRKAYAAALGAVACWSTVAAAFKLTLAHIGSDALVVYSAAAALVFLGAVTLVTGSLGEFRQWSAADVLRSATLGSLNPFLYYLVLFKAYDLLPAHRAQPLNFAWPVVLVALSAILLRQRIRAVSYAALAISFSGVVIIATHGNPLSFTLSDPLGVALALGSTVVWALYWLYSASDARDPVNRLAANFAFGLAYVALYAAASGRLEWPSAAAAAGSVYIGVMEMGLGFVFWLRALKLSRTTAEVGNLIYLTPFLSLMVIAVVVGERIGPATGSGWC